MSEPHVPAGRRAVVLALVAALVVAGAALLGPAVARDADAPPAAAKQGTASGVRPAPTLDGVRAYEVRLGHTLEDVDYAQSPPVGGQHHPVWLECGVYDEEVPEEHLVHDLEHGTIWLTYRPGLGEAKVAALAALLPDDGILSPYAEQDDPVVATVWERQLALTGVDDPRLPLFLSELGTGETAPEPFASCAGGATLEELERLDPGDPEDPDGSVQPVLARSGAWTARP